MRIPRDLAILDDRDLHKGFSVRLIGFLPWHALRCRTGAAERIHARSVHGDVEPCKLSRDSGPTCASSRHSRSGNVWKWHTLLAATTLPKFLKRLGGNLTLAKGSIRQSNLSVNGASVARFKVAVDSMTPHRAIC